MNKILYFILLFLVWISLPFLYLIDWLQDRGVSFLWGENLGVLENIKRKPHFYGVNIVWFQFGVTVWKIPQSQKKVLRPH